MTETCAPAGRRYVCAAVLGLVLGFGALCAHASDLPLASRSSMTGVTFEDRPLALPVQINFRMAMLSASTELGRSCGKMEAYGWRMGASEQARVDQIFNATVEAMRRQGYFIQSESPAAVSRDITLFTADRLNQHYIFMWSAGEVGLVMVICESSPPLTGRAVMAAGRARAEESLAAQDVLQSPPTGKGEPMKGAFTPIGVWKGEYTCLPQGYTGATLQIFRLKGEDFEGEFHFYPTPKNAGIPEGRYEVYGQYDAKSRRMLINPGQWLRQPQGYAASVMVGGFDVATRTFSAYFQGVNGCTSFEAKRVSGQTGSGASKAQAKATKKGKTDQQGAASLEKSGKKTPHPKDSLKSLKPVIIGGPRPQGKAAPPPSTRQKIDRDFSSALKSDDANGYPYAKLEEEAPRYATEQEEKIPQDKTPAAQFDILPSQVRASLESSAENRAGKSGWRDYLARKGKTKVPPATSESVESVETLEAEEETSTKTIAGKNLEARNTTQKSKVLTGESGAGKDPPPEQKTSKENDTPPAPSATDSSAPPAQDSAIFP